MALRDQLSNSSEGILELLIKKLYQYNFNKINLNQDILFKIMAQNYKNKV